MSYANWTLGVHRQKEIQETIEVRFKEDRF
jgi:hypothetical protein